MIVRKGEQFHFYLSCYKLRFGDDDFTKFVIGMKHLDLPVVYLIMNHDSGLHDNSVQYFIFES